MSERDAAAIEREIETTRAQLANTLDDLADKASPRRALDRVKQQVTGTPKGRAALGAAAGLVVTLVGLRIRSGRKKK